MAKEIEQLIKGSIKVNARDVQKMRIGIIFYNAKQWVTVKESSSLTFTPNYKRKIKIGHMKMKY